MSTPPNHRTTPLPESTPTPPRCRSGRTNYTEKLSPGPVWVSQARCLECGYHYLFQESGENLDDRTCNCNQAFDLPRIRFEEGEEPRRNETPHCERCRRVPEPNELREFDGCDCKVLWDLFLEPSPYSHEHLTTCADCGGSVISWFDDSGEAWGVCRCGPRCWGNGPCTPAELEKQCRQYLIDVDENVHLGAWWNREGILAKQERLSKLFKDGWPSPFPPIR